MTEQLPPDDQQTRRRSLATIRELEATEKDCMKRDTDYVAWLLKHWNHPDRMKIVGDRNNNLVKLNATRTKLNNLQNGEPMLGTDLGVDTSGKRNGEPFK